MCSTISMNHSFSDVRRPSVLAKAPGVREARPPFEAVRGPLARRLRLQGHPIGLLQGSSVPKERQKRPPGAVASPLRRGWGLKPVEGFRYRSVVVVASPLRRGWGLKHGRCGPRRQVEKGCIPSSEGMGIETYMNTRIRTATSGCIPSSEGMGIETRQYCPHPLSIHRCIPSSEGMGIETTWQSRWLPA